MSHVLTKRYLYGFNGIGTRFCSSFKSVSIVSRTHCVDFDICSDIDRFYKANSYSTYYSLTLCQLKCTWSQSNPLEYQSIRSISDENLSFQKSISLYSRSFIKFMELTTYSALPTTYSGIHIFVIHYRLHGLIQ